MSSFRYIPSILESIPSPSGLTFLLPFNFDRNEQLIRHWTLSLTIRANPYVVLAFHSSVRPAKGNENLPRRMNFETVLLVAYVVGCGQSTRRNWV